MTIRRHFYDTTSPELSVDSGLYKPAALFEASVGIIGISGQYLFPDDMTASEYEVYSGYTNAIWAYYKIERPSYEFSLQSTPDSDLMQKMQRDWQDLIQLNPELIKISVNVEDALSLHDAIHGVACLLNVDDIDFMLRSRQETRCLVIPSSPLMSTLRTEIETMTKQPIGWVASEKTLQAIKEKLEGVGTDVKPPSPPLDSYKFNY